MKLFTVQQVAEILGVKEKTVRDWIWKKRIETVRNGSRYVRISESVILHFIETHTVPAEGTVAVGKKVVLSADRGASDRREPLRAAPILSRG